MLAKNDEHKRSILWRAAMTVSSVLIIVIAAFFLIKLFTDNPLEGNWIYEDSDLTIYVKGNGTVTVQWPEAFESADVSVQMQYSVNKDDKIFTLHKDETKVEEAAERAEGAVTISELDSALTSLEGSYDYNIEQGVLTLTEREYGEQMVFMKK